MRLAPHERRQIERLAQVRGTTMKDAVLAAVRLHLEGLAAREEPGEAAPYVPQGRLRGGEHLIGSERSGLTDLASNPDHLGGYGR